MCFLPPSLGFVLFDMRLLAKENVSVGGVVRRIDGCVYKAALDFSDGLFERKEQIRCVLVKLWRLCLYGV